MLDSIRRMAKDGLARGWYLASVSSVARSLRRVQLQPHWTADALEHARRISSPILDIIPTVGARVAVLSQDGVIEAPAYIGQVWDDLQTPEQMTAWVRAHLEEHPGQLELGAAKGLRLRVGSNDVDITPLEDGRLLIEATGTVVLKAPRIDLGEDADDGVVRKSDLVATANALIRAFNLHTHVVPNGTSDTPLEPLTHSPSSSTTTFSL